VSFKVTRLVRSARLPRTMPRRAQVKAVLLALSDRCDDDGFNAWPSVATIAAETELAERAVQYALRHLEAADLIGEQEKPRQHRPRTWFLNLDELVRLSPEVSIRAPLEYSGVQPETPLSYPQPTSEVQPGVSTPTLGVHVEAPRGVNPDARGANCAPDPILLNCSSLNYPLNEEPAPAARRAPKLSDADHQERHERLKAAALVESVAAAGANLTEGELIDRVESRTGCHDRVAIAAAVTFVRVRRTFRSMSA
jgi:hypothetical protein